MLHCTLIKLWLCNEHVKCSIDMTYPIDMSWQTHLKLYFVFCYAESLHMPQVLFYHRSEHPPTHCVDWFHVPVHHATGTKPRFGCFPPKHMTYHNCIQNTHSHPSPLAGTLSKQPTIYPPPAPPPSKSPIDSQSKVKSKTPLLSPFFLTPHFSLYFKTLHNTCCLLRFAKNRSRMPS